MKMKTHGVGHTLQSLGLALGTAMWLVAPLGALLFLRSAVDTMVVLEKPEAVWVEAQPAQGESREGIGVGFTWTQDPELFAPTWSGVVQFVVTPGTVLNSGDVVAVIDGIERVAAQTDVPFYRELDHGAVGPDVQMLNELLQDWGYAADAGNRISSTSVEAIGLLAADLGVTDRESRRAFDPSWFVFLPVKSYFLAEISLNVGASAPSAGEVVGKAAARVAEAVLVDTAAVDKLAGTVGSDGVPTIDWSRYERREVPPTARVEFNGEALTLSPNRTALSDEAARVVADGLVAGVTSGMLEMVTPASAEGAIVPAASVIVDGAGAVCVRVKSQAGAADRAVPVEVVSSDAGQAGVLGAVSPGDLVGVGVRGADRQCS
jgi:hypothetical protein